MIHIETKGFTLIELLVGIAITSIVGVLMVSAYQMQVRSKNTQEALTDMNQAARAAFEIMAGEIRMAGLDPLMEPVSKDEILPRCQTNPSKPTANARIILATVGELIFSLDRNDGPTNESNGDCCDNNEVIRYRLTNDADSDGINDAIASGTACNLGRETGCGLCALDPDPAPICNRCCPGCANRGGLQPLARSVDVLNFVYLDNNSNPIPYANLTTQAGRAAIRSIQISMVARAGLRSEGFFYSYTNNESYTNLQGTQILAPQGDNFRRLVLSTTVICRNLGN